MRPQTRRVVGQWNASETSGSDAAEEKGEPQRDGAEEEAEDQ
jgi:hypothetical protein